MGALTPLFLVVAPLVLLFLVCLCGRLGILGIQSFERGRFDWQYYFPLRDQGLSHKEAIGELDRVWSAMYPNGEPKRWW